MPNLSLVKNEDNRSYESKIRVHRATFFYRAALILIVAIALILLIWLQYKRHIYTAYDIVSSIEREKSVNARDMRFEDTILTYSKDGAHCTDNKGTVKWNQTYEIQEILMDINKDVSAFASYNGRNIYVNSTSEQMGTVTTNMPIRDIAVARNGYVTAILADTNVTWVNTYDVNKDEMIYKASTTMSNSGYPAALDLSPSGELLAVAYVYVDAGMVKTNISFYNFGAVGDNQSDYLVSVHTYTDMLVPDIRFIDDQTAVAIGDSRIMIFKGKQKPVSEAEYSYDEEIRSVFSGNGYVGVVFYSEDAESRYRMDVFDTDGKRRGRYYFNVDYTDVLFEKNDFVVYNETECVIMTYAGDVKFEGSFTKSIDTIIPTNTAYRYILVTDETLDTIQLK